MKKTIVMFIAIILGINIVSTSLGVEAFAAITNPKTYDLSKSKSENEYNGYSLFSAINNWVSATNNKVVNSNGNNLGDSSNSQQINNGTVNNEPIDVSNKVLNQIKNNEAEQNVVNALKRINQNTTETTVPKIPTGVKTYTTDGQIIVVWRSVSNADEYEIEVDGNVVNNGSKTMFFHENLVAGTMHTYRVRAKNSVGTSEWSEYVNQEAINKNIQAPENIVTNATVDSITISWDKVQSATSYDIEVDGDIQDNGISNQYIHKGLKEDSVHTYRVRAKNGSIIGKWSQTYVVNTTKNNATNTTDDKNVNTTEGASTNTNIKEKVQTSQGEISNKSVMKSHKYMAAATITAATSTPVVTATGTPIATSTPTSDNTNNNQTKENSSEEDNQSNQVQDLTISQDYTLQGDLVCNNLNLSGGTVNLNGFKLIVLGNLVQSGGIIGINGGSLEVGGDYTITGYSTIRMTNEKDYVLVNGNFTINSSCRSINCLTAGVLEVKGDITQNSTTASDSKYNLFQSGSFKLVISGDKISTVTMANPYESMFYTLDISKSAGVVFKTEIRVVNTIIFGNQIIGDVTFNSSNIKLNEESVINGNLVLKGTSLTLNNDLVVNGDVVFTGGYIYLNGHKLIIKGSLKQEGWISINGGRLEVGGDYTITGYSTIGMTNEKDYVLVNGNFTINSSCRSIDRLTAGVLEVKGNVTQNQGNNGEKANFKQGENFTVKLSGDKQSIVSIENVFDSEFYKIDSTEKSGGVKFATRIRLRNLAGLENVVDGVELYYSYIDFSESVIADYNITLTNCTVFLNDYSFIIHGNLNCNDGVTSIDGSYLYVSGNLSEHEQSTYLEGGCLIIDGNYTIDGQSRLEMTNYNDYILVGGDFTIATEMSELGKLTNGVLEIRGSFTQKGDRESFDATDNHTVKFSGQSVHKVVFESPNQSKFAKLEIGDNEGLIWDHEEINPLTVTGSFFLGMKDAVVDTVGSIAEIFTNLSGTLKSAVYLCTIFSSPLFESEQAKVVLSLYDQMGDWMEKEIFYGNANDRARAAGYILANVIMAVFGAEEFEAITKALKVVSESKALLYLGDSLNGFIKLDKYEDVIGNGTLREKIADVFRGGCFTGDTLVETDNGFKRIDEIKVGDNVLSWNPETKANEYKKVISLYQTETICFVNLVIDGKLIETTLNHPFMTVAGEWIEAGRLKVGDKVVTADGEIKEIQSAKIVISDSTRKVYNFTVQDNHTYYVSEEMVLVHNGTCGEITEGAAEATKKGWQVGDDINALTKAGKYPSWNTVKSRYWKNMANAAEEGEYSAENLAKMTKGRAPLHDEIGVPKELHHIEGRGGTDPHNINNLIELWPWEHADVDPFRFYNGPRP